MFLRADKTVPYGELMALMNELRGAGYLHVALVGLERRQGGAVSARVKRHRPLGPLLRVRAWAFTPPARPRCWRTGTTMPTWWRTRR